MKRNKRVLISSALALVVMTFNACGKAIAPQTIGGSSSSELASSSGGGTGSTDDTSGGGSPSAGGSTPPVTNPPNTPPITNPPITPPPSTVNGKITLPIEIYGSEGTFSPIQFDATSSQVAASKSLYLQVHGLNTIEEASVQLNNSPWVALTDDNLQLYPLEKAYGGIGGGFATVRGTVAVQSSWLAIGKNTIRFRFNKTDGFTHGYRILAFNLRNASNQDLLSSTLFQQDDPSKWTAPLNNPTDIQAGKDLWYKAQLSTPNSPKINAHCTDCHVQDGRDLKYFNYSNFVIKTRAVFHGLTPTQGDQIASYIRSLNQPAPGRPWNPPYQPGPGLDSKPISEWAAGAGLNAVLDNDTDTLKYIFPKGFSDASVAGRMSYLNARETPVAIQFLDWNRWLPQVHPFDAYPDYINSQTYKEYLKLRANLKVGDAANYSSTDIRQIFTDMGVRGGEFRIATRPPIVEGQLWPVDQVRAQYGLATVGMVKSFEIMQEFKLEGFGKAWFGPQAADRAWNNNGGFMTSPNMVHIPRGSEGLHNGKVVTNIYTSFAWYQLQLALNDSNKKHEGTTPIDWGYIFGFINEMGTFSPQLGILVFWTTKGVQIMETGRGPDAAESPWRFDVSSTYKMASPIFKQMAGQIPAPERNILYATMLRTWLDQVKSFTPAQFIAGGFDPNEEFATVNPFDNNGKSRIRYLLETYKAWGVDAALLRDTADWAQTIWPSFQWRTGLGL